SHPKIQGIMLWGFWEKRHWRPRAALFAADWSIRPVGNAWIDLVDKQWKTQATATTDNAGKAAFRGFFGDYDLTISHKDKRATARVNFSRDGASAKVNLD